MQANGISVKKLILQDALHTILKHLIQSPLTEFFNIDIILHNTVAFATDTQCSHVAKDK